MLVHLLKFMHKLTSRHFRTAIANVSLVHRAVANHRLIKSEVGTSYYIRSESANVELLCIATHWIRTGSCIRKNSAGMMSRYENSKSSLSEKFQIFIRNLLMSE